MMIEPPIDDLVSKTDDNKYKLCRLVSTRAKELELEIPNEIEASDKKAITLALEEIINDEVVMTTIEKKDE